MTSNETENKPKPVAKKATKSKAVSKKPAASKKKPLKVAMAKPKVVDTVAGYEIGEGVPVAGYEIEEGVPVPEANTGRSGGKSEALLKLKVGQRIKELARDVKKSDFKNDKEFALAVKDEIRKARARLTVAKRRVEKNNEGLQFVVREIDGGAACWRLK